MTHGFRIKRTWTRIGADLVAAFRELPVANVSDSMFRIAAFGAELRPMHASGVLAGPALIQRPMMPRVEVTRNIALNSSATARVTLVVQDAQSMPVTVHSRQSVVSTAMPLPA